MPIDMRRPQAPDVTQWIDTTDERLAGHVRSRRRRPRSRPPAIDRLARIVRSLARPAAHGAAAVAATIVVAIAVQVPATDPPPAGSSTVPDTVAPVEPSSTPVSGPAISPTRAPDITLLPRDDAAALRRRSDIETPQAGLTGVPHGSAPAVPTPDGGGSATAALRPTVR